MDGKIKAERKKNPREGANPLKILTFTFTLPTFWLGYRRDLEISDLYKPLKEHTSNHLGAKISKVWQKEYDAYVKEKRLIEEKEDHEKYHGKTRLKEPSLSKTLIKCFGPQIMLYGIILAVLEITLRLSQPIFLGLLIRYYSRTIAEPIPLHTAMTRIDNSSDSQVHEIEDAMKPVLQPICLGNLLQYYSTGGVTKDEAYLYAGGVVLCSALLLFVMHPYMMGILHIGMKMRIACCTLIYRKALKLSRTALGETTIGQAVNLLSNDVNRFDVALIHLNYLWIGPLETIIITYFMYQQVEVSALFGVAILLLFIPLQGYLGKKSSIYRLKTALRTDERVRLTNEIITGIQAIKMYCWEKPFSDLIQRARKREITVIRNMSMIRGITISFIMFTTRMSLFVTILAYIFYNHEKITATKVFMLQAYYNILRQTMTVFFPQGITQMAELLVSVKRLQRFMMYEEIDIRNTDEKGSQNKETKQNDANNVEKDMNNTSHGKREMTNNYQGDYVINLKNSSAKWLSYEQEDTLKNIDFTLKPGELVAVVGQVGCGKSSFLNLILKELPTATGSIEINGKIAYAGQEPWLFAGSVRQNILFGRPMDQFRYDRVVKACQLKRDFTLLPYGDKTIVGERGISLSGGQRARINLARAVYAEADTYLLDDPLSAVDAHVGKHMFEECIIKYLKGKARIIVTHQLQHLRNVDRILVLKDGHIHAEGSYDELSRMGIDFGRLLENPEEEEGRAAGSSPPSRSNSRNASISSLSSLKSTSTEKDDPLEVAESRTKGKVSGKVYVGYFSAGGNCCVLFVVLMLLIVSQTLASGSDFFISQWVNMEEKYVTGADDVTEEDWGAPISRQACIYIYSALIASTVVITLIRSAAVFVTSMRASKRLHDRMFRSISRATMLFFNTNVSGRILNRFSKDMGAIDELLPMALIDTLQIGLSLLAIITVVAIANYWLLIPTVVIGLIFYYIRVFYLATSRSVKRLEGVTRSPVFTHLSATLQGLSTIRAFEAEEILAKEFDEHQDLHSSAWYIFISSSRAFGFWLDFFCVVYICLVTLSFLLINDQTTGGNVGLAITQSIGLTGMFQWGMRQSTELENQMTSVERVLEYTNVESEPPLESAPDKKPKETWPEESKIEFKNMYLRYNPVEAPVLKNLNFVIYPQEKIGIVGRTGAGKSSLIAALFRLANIEGTITIDGVNTLEIGLHDLRSKISIIPQEPFLFSGSLRKNLDPFDQYESDSVLWQALEEVELKEMGLEGHINEGGSNLSVGQRQLVCLARAIVKNNPILVLDEATANVDPQTDGLIQKTIRTKFANCTVLTIAHRLNTVMDSDRILVMDAGSVVEFDAPYLLIQKNGYLNSMIKETGPAMADALKEVARVSYKNRTSTAL